MKALFGINGEQGIEKVLREELGKYGIDVDGVVCRSTKDSLKRELELHTMEYGMVVLYESMETGRPYSVVEVERLAEIDESIAIVFVVEDSHRGDMFMQTLFDSGFYSALYGSNAYFDQIASVAVHGRSKRAAKDYYGLTGASKKVEAPKKEDNGPVLEEPPHRLTRSERKALERARRQEEAALREAAEQAVTEHKSDEVEVSEVPQPVFDAEPDVVEVRVSEEIRKSEPEPAQFATDTETKSAVEDLDKAGDVPDDSRLASEALSEDVKETVSEPVADESAFDDLMDFTMFAEDDEESEAVIEPVVLGTGDSLVSASPDTKIEPAEEVLRDTEELSVSAGVDVSECPENAFTESDAVASETDSATVSVSDDLSFDSPFDLPDSDLDVQHVLDGAWEDIDSTEEVADSDVVGGVVDETFVPKKESNVVSAASSAGRDVSPAKEPVKEPVKLTAGRWADIITDEEDLEKRKELITEASHQLDREAFLRLISFLPQDVLAALRGFAVVDDACEKVHVAESVALHQKQAVKLSDLTTRQARKMVGVCCGENPDAATFLAYTLARRVGGGLSGGAFSTYLEMPGVSTRRPGAFSLLGIGDKCHSFVSHLQQISNGYAFPAEHNFVDNVSVVCENPYSDILDDWSVGNAFKALYGVDSPVFVDLGDLCGSGEICKAVLSALDILIVVAGSVDGSTSVFMDDFSDRYGVPSDKKTILVVDDGMLGDKVNSEFFGEVHSYGLVRCSNYGDFLKSCADSSLISDIGGMCGFEFSGESVVSENRRAVRKEKKERLKREKAKAGFSGIVEIGVCASGSGAGATFDSIAFASSLSERYKVAYLECGPNRILNCLGDHCGARMRKSPAGSYFSVRGVDFFYRVSYEDFMAVYRGRNVYDFVVVDYGTDFVNPNFARADVKVAAIRPGIWNTDTVNEFMVDSRSIDRDNSIVWAVGFASTKELSDYRKIFRRKNIYGIPYCTDPFVPSFEVKDVIGRILGINLWK